jgi:hypothetical protein
MTYHSKLPDDLKKEEGEEGVPPDQYHGAALTRVHRYEQKGKKDRRRIQITDRDKKTSK